MTGYIIKFNPPLQKYFLRDYMTGSITTSPEYAFMFDCTPEWKEIAKDYAKQWDGVVKKVTIEPKITFYSKAK